MKKSYLLSLSAVALACFSGGWISPAAGSPEVSSLAQASNSGAASFTLSPIAGRQIRNAPIPVTIIARDSQGAVIPDYTGAPSFTAAGPSGPIEVFTPTAGGFVAGVYTGNVTIGQYAEGVVLTASADGMSVASNAFDVARGPMNRLTWAQVASPQTVDTPFSVRLRAEDAGGNLVEDFAEDVSLAALSLSPGAPTGTGTRINRDLDSHYSQSRFQCVYTPAEVGGTGPLTALAMEIGELPELPYEEFTIRVKHTSRANYDAPHPGWETDGWTVVYRGSVRIEATGWHTFPFTVPFDYDGTSNLMVDFSFNGEGWGYAGGYLASVTSDSRKIDYQTLSGDSPLTWSGESDYFSTSNELPNLRFTSYNALSPIRPATTGAFSGGVWNGVVSVPFTAGGVKLFASDGAEHRGASDGFAVEAAKPVIRPGTITETFEKLPLENAWKFTGTGTHRTEVSTYYKAHGGTRHLLMDSGTYGYSRNEATWTVDLRGLSGVTLKFWAKRGYEEYYYQTTPSPPSPFTDGADFNGVAISTNGTKWYEVQSFREIERDWTQFSVDLDSAIASLGLTYNTSFRIRFNHYERGPMDGNGLLVDDIEITSKQSPYLLKVSGPGQVREGDGPARFAVTLPSAVATDTVVNLVSSAPAKATVPGQVTVPAGRLSASFMVQPADDSLADGPKTIEIIATNPLLSGTAHPLVVLDNDGGGLAFTVPSTATTEGADPLQGTVSIAEPAVSPTTFIVTSGNTKEITVPATVTIPLGATSAPLPVTIVDDSRLDGLQSTTVTVAEPGGGLSKSVTIHVADNETLDLQLVPSTTPAPSSVNESGGGISFVASLPGGVTTASTLTFSSSSPAKIIPPAPNIIPAGNISSTATFTLVDDQVSQASEPVTLTVSSPGFNSASYVLTFLDNDPHHFTISPIASPQVLGAPIAVTVTACDPSGGPVAGFLGPVTLGAGGRSIIPTSLATFAGGVHNGTLRINEAADDVVLTVADSQGHTGTSNPFDVGPGAFQRLAWAPMPSTRPPASNIPVALKAVDAGGNVDPSVNGPVTLRALTPVPAFTVGEGEGSTWYFLFTFYERCRSQVIYLADEIGGKRTLGGIALNVKSGADGQKLTNFTIRLKTTTRGQMDPSAGWDGDGWTVVHKSTPILSGNGWVTLLFDVPFEYDGQENLLVDYSYNSPSDFSLVDWTADYHDGENRVLYGYSSSSTDPLSWSGPGNTGYTSSYLPQTRFLTLQPVAANLPASSEISGGTWNGLVSFTGNIDRVFLEAVDSSGHYAFSDALRIGAPALPAKTSLPFSDGFETGTLSSAWETSATGRGSVRVASTDTPHTGTGHAVSDTTYDDARTELTLPLDLTGHTGVVLDFWAKRFDSTDDGPPSAPFTEGADFDGVAMSADGNHWYEIQPLRGMTAKTWTRFTVDLDAAAAAHGLVYTSDFRIRFNQFGDSSAPYDGLAIDDVSVTGNAPGRLTLGLPDWMGENSGIEEGSVQLPSAVATDTVVELASSSPLALTVPSSVIIPAGETGVTFNVTAVNNSTLNGPLRVNVTGTAVNLAPATAAVELRDDESGTPALSAPDAVYENENSGSATLTISTPATGALVFSLTSSLPATVQVPATVRIPSGQTSVSFPLNVVPDYKFTGPREALLSASLDGWPTATAPVTVLDEQSRPFNWSPSSTDFAVEGDTRDVRIIAHGIVSEDLVLTLSSSDTSRLTLPATATIPAGTQMVSVPITGVDNNAVEGDRTVTITASTGGHLIDTRDLQVRDNDAHRFTFDPVHPRQFSGQAFPVSVSAYDLEDRLISNYWETLPITATGDSGTLGISPATLSFSGGVAVANMTINTVSENVRLRVSPDAVPSATSGAFSVMATGPAKYNWSTISATKTAGTPFTATITARDAGNNLMSGHTGFVALSTFVAERVIGQGTNYSEQFPLSGNYPNARTQSIYLPGEVGPANTLSSLSFYVAVNPPGYPASPPVTAAWTIRMKHTTLASHTARTWDNSGWTTVFSGNQTLPESGWATFHFSTPFAYNGTSNLLVEFIHAGANSSYRKVVRNYPATVNRTLFGISSSGGSPVNWSGSNPSAYPVNAMPQIKLNSGIAGGPVAPSTVLLTNGVWTGSLSIGKVTPSFSIVATDLNGMTGKSNNFSVVSSPDSDGDGLPNFWETANGLASNDAAAHAGAMGDLDGDGVPNLLEYAFNLDPSAAGTTGLPSSVTMANPVDGGDYLEFTYRRRLGAAGVSYIIETSADCKTWSAAATQYETAAGPLPTGDGVTETVTVRILPKITATAVRFARLRVAAP
ncbi:hypothetical protein JIN84_00135 [Luteolibacter yonseiensis]|uniref:Uncharacterized protein n=1 Tax=Luteolibacter yonseiensis TaxID=1144680 RepID=A0A934VA54_9BACT|nr:hypothetical protein [Luteolibacter yonseiensis]MBK1814014.1 hypothetical protein [Luteolibacter yonseiensis]